MTDHVLETTRSVTQAPGRVLPFIARLVRNWKAKRAITRLQDFDDYMLRDIGVTRLDVRWATELPLSTNAALELEKRSLRRRRGEIRD